MSQSIKLVTPNWPAPKNVRSIETTRSGGFSKDEFAGFNLATHVGDDPRRVEMNRELLRKYLPSNPVWLNQVHGVAVWNDLQNIGTNEAPTADAAVTNKPNQVLSIMTADCLPILFATTDGSVVGAAHAGWRGLCGGVIEKTVDSIHQHLKEMNIEPNNEELIVWLGTSIGRQNFEVGQEVLDAFLQEDKAKSDIASCFKQANVSGKYLADLHGLAKIRLANLGITRIYGDSHCCFDDKENYFSYRREKTTGRFATLIWIE